MIISLPWKDVLAAHTQKKWKNEKEKLEKLQTLSYELLTREKSMWHKLSPAIWEWCIQWPMD